MTIDEVALARVDSLLRKGEQLLATKFESGSGMEWVEGSIFAGWRAQTLVYLENLTGRDGNYCVAFAKETEHSYFHYVQAGVEILRVVREDISNGHVGKIATQISAEVFTDFVEMAEHLLQSGNDAVIPIAAFICGAVLEDGLRRILRNKAITLKDSEDISSLSQKCVQNNVYNDVERKRVQFWSDIRNQAAHGRFDQFNRQQVEEMLRGVVQFLATYLR